MPVVKSQGGEDYTGATVIEPEKGLVHLVFLVFLVFLIALIIFLPPLLGTTAFLLPPWTSPRCIHPS